MNNANPPSAPLFKSGVLQRFPLWLREGRCAAAGSPPAYPLRVKRGTRRDLLLAAFLFLNALTAFATESDWHTSWDGTLYGYANSSHLRSDSILNPDNQIARLAQRSGDIEASFNFKAESEAVRLTARPIVALREERNTFGAQQQREAYLSQWQLRVRADDAWNLAAGREVLNWGAAQFRSPSSPFYFDNGRNNPMRKLSGVDVLKVSWTPNQQRSVHLIRVLDSGYSAPQPDQNHKAWLIKIDQRGDDSALGLAILKTPNRAAFIGFNGQRTVSDALLIYAELSSATQSNALNSPADATFPFTVSAESARKTTGLLGSAYTFENGHTLSAEYLHDDHGYTASQQRAYFLRAANQPGMALGLAPRLLGRDYVHLVWQNNLMESSGYGRLMLTHSLTDSSNELAGYFETSFSKRISAFALGVVNYGNPQQEFSALSARSVMLGLKTALP